MLTDNEIIDLINKWRKEADEYRVLTTACWDAGDCDGANSFSMAEGILRRVAGELYRKLNG